MKALTDEELQRFARNLQIEPHRFEPRDFVGQVQLGDFALHVGSESREHELVRDARQ